MRWTNGDSSATEKIEVPGAEPAGIHIIQPGSSTDLSFPSAGTFGYTCEVEGGASYKGNVIVGSG